MGLPGRCCFLAETSQRHDHSLLRRRTRWPTCRSFSRKATASALALDGLAQRIKRPVRRYLERAGRWVARVAGPRAPCVQPADGHCAGLCCGCVPAGMAGNASCRSRALGSDSRSRRSGEGVAAGCGGAATAAAGGPSWSMALVDSRLRAAWRPRAAWRCCGGASGAPAAADRPGPEQQGQRGPRVWRPARESGDGALAAPSGHIASARPSAVTNNRYKKHI
jgi:hypothetical protein